MKAYTGKLEIRDDVVPTITVSHLGADRSFLTHGSEEMGRSAFVDGMFFHLLTFDPVKSRYILETLEPTGASCRRLQAFATVDEVEALGGEKEVADNLQIAVHLVQQLSYEANAFAAAHEAARVRSEARLKEVQVTVDEKAFYASMMNPHRLSASQRRQIRDDLIPAMKERGEFPALSK